MEGCSSMSPWTDMYQQGGIDTSHEIMTWDEGTPHNNDHHQNLLPMMNPITGCNNMMQYQPFDLSKIYDATTSSIDQSLECLLSGTNSNIETTSDEDDGISMLFSSKNNCPQNYWNFSSNNTVTGPVHRTGIPTSNNNNNHPRKRSQKCLENQQKHMKKQRSNNTPPKNISFQIQPKQSTTEDDQDEETIQEMKEMIYRAAAFRPVSFGVDPVQRPKRKNVRISNDPQTAAARQRRERISERLRLLQKLVPGGTKLDTASMLDEAASYLKFLRNQVHDLETFGANKVNNHQFHLTGSTHNPFFTTPPNLQFSPTPMQGNTSTTTSLPLFLPPNPNFTHVPKI